MEYLISISLPAMFPEVTSMHTACVPSISPTEYVVCWTPIVTGVAACIHVVYVVENAQCLIRTMSYHQHQ